MPASWDAQQREFPVWQVRGTCAVGVFAKFQDSKDVFPASMVAQKAAQVMDACVRLRNQQLKLGGRIDIGAKRDFLIAVYGRNPNPGESLGVPGLPESNVTAIA